jgi:hypothetical protein
MATYHSAPGRFRPLVALLAIALLIATGQTLHAAINLSNTSTVTLTPKTGGNTDTGGGGTTGGGGGTTGGGGGTTGGGGGNTHDSPEPASLALGLVGTSLALVIGAVRRRKSAAQVSA